MTLGFWVPFRPTISRRRKDLKIGHWFIDLHDCVWLRRSSSAELFFWARWMVESTWRTEVAAFFVLFFWFFRGELDPTSMFLFAFAHSCHSFVLPDGELVQNPPMEIFASTTWILFVLRPGCDSADSGMKPYYSWRDWITWIKHLSSHSVTGRIPRKQFLQRSRASWCKSSA